MSKNTQNYKLFYFIFSSENLEVNCVFLERERERERERESNKIYIFKRTNNRKYYFVPNFYFCKPYIRQ
ncbi:hypothetical protein GGR21_001152 [Dysgonomonas hofstadii]|uniref:Uncharacterized protein n=1 Tax=Dysgonomonas hofstadii TaxID=637886 RepID=A0A840CU90_9BACT|nr:hypothetical protein [Dysgonomonas hofstadii]